MNLFDLVLLALRQLGKNKLRSGLTVLGVVIGIAAVTTMVSIGQGATELVQKQFQNLGSNVIVVLPARSQQQGAAAGQVPTLTAADGAAIAAECPSVKAVTPFVPTSGQVVGGNVNWSPNEMQGVGPDYPIVRNWPIIAGSFFTESEVAAGAKVCVLGQTLVNRLFPGTDPIGQMVRVKNIPFRVIGVFARKGANMAGVDQDDIIVMPYTTVKKRLQGSPFNNVAALLVSATSEQLAQKAEQEIRALLAERHRISPGQPPDFQINNTIEIANVLGTITTSLTLMLSAIAAISLLVGGVGIMNIMLVSVTERTREIGIRMALGARPRDILRQFLVESIVLSTFGGLIGLSLGYAASLGMTHLINAILPSADWPFVVSMPAGLVALVFSAAVGVFFGYYPARRASQLDPIEALRYE
ncbi:MAG: ABC transporter permease [Gemmataceae bacterium]